MYIKSAMKKVQEAQRQYEDGLIHEAEFVNIALDCFMQVRDRLAKEASTTLNILGAEHNKE